jgi:CspA family cold shock protein
VQLASIRAAANSASARLPRRRGRTAFQQAGTAAELASLRIGRILTHRHWSLNMARGTVKWFNPTKGYGFIQPAGGGGKDVFVHISAVEKAGLSTLNEGQTVEYEEVPNKGKTSAEKLKIV